VLVAFVSLAVASASSVQAGATPAQKCESSKLKGAGKACDCRFHVASKALRSGDTPDFTKCQNNLFNVFAKANDKGGCPINSETPTVNNRLIALVSDVSTALQAGTAMGDAAIRCAADKLKAAGKKCACIHKAQATATQKSITPDFSKCEAKFDLAYAKAEAKADGACPTIGDADAICDAVDADLAEIEADIADRDTAMFAELGPYGVGLRTVTWVDESRPTMANGNYPGAPDRTLNVSIWYPANPGQPVAIVTDAPLASTGGPFPLILRAHGFSGFRGDSIYLVRHLASRGYVVVAPDFPLSTLGAPGGPTLGDVGEQARDLSFLIDTYTAENANPMSFLSGRLDLDRIGAIGHSLGGATVLLATYHGTLKDPRIDATVALSPLACVFLDGFFDSSTVPLMIQGGTFDQITPYTSNQLDPYGIVNAPRYLFTLNAGLHLGFSDRLLFAPTENGDEEVGCPLFLDEGDPRPMTIDPGLPPDYLGGPAAYVDPSGSQCEPICPLPTPGHMLHARQNALAKAGALAFFESKLLGSVSAGRLITGRLDTDNADATLAFEE
jgi:dienelactone hydrolase